MKKKNLADKMAEKFLGSQKFKEHWDTHMLAFGPILEPAFKDDPQSRLHLVNALSNISRGELKDGIKLLDKIHENIKTDEDDAAWLFFMGLVFDLAEIKDNMMQYYMASCEYNHLFYMPYMKIAKNAYADRAFDAAEDYFKRAIYSITQSGFPNDATAPVMLASAYTHLASVLTSMHRYEEAEGFMELSEQTVPSQSGRSSTKAILMAAMGRKEEACECIEILKDEAPQFAEETSRMVDDILNKRSASFFEVAVDESALDSFWKWFEENEDGFRDMIENESYDEFFATMNDRMLEVFPFMKATFEFGIEPLEGSYHIILADFYAVGLNAGYEKLIARCPEGLKDRWSFSIDR